MLNDALLAIAHHLFAFLLLACLTAEWVLLLQAPTSTVARKLALFDAGYGLAALGSLGAGIARLLWGLKPASYYTGNPVFWAKLGLWGAVGILSIVPTVRFLKWRRQEPSPSQSEFDETRRLVALELLLFTGIPALAALMARGFGY
jgi:putative membrane protein